MSEPERTPPFRHPVPGGEPEGALPQAVDSSSNEIANTAETFPAASVRGATLDDLESLVRIELGAFSDVYGSEPDGCTVTNIRQTYRRRLEMMGDWVRVMEHPSAGVFGMLVICKTSYDKDDFIGLDMTDARDIEAVYDPEGRNTYVVNMAILPHNQHLGNSWSLYIDAVLRGKQEGIENVYFESRIPRLGKWIEAQIGHEAAQNLTGPELDEYAQRYWQTTAEFDDKPGVARPIDGLLRIYADMGAVPLKLIKDAWQRDEPSKAYGVLCELVLARLPIGEETASKDEPSDTPGTPADDTVAIIEHVPANSAELENLEDPRHSFNFLKKAVKKLGWKRSGLLGSAVGVSGYELATGSTQHLLHELSANAPWAVEAYGGSLAAFVVSGGLALAAAGVSTRNPFKLKEHAQEIGVRLRQNRFLRANFFINRASAVGAAAVVGAGIVEVLPPSGWAALALPIADLYNTYGLGSVVYSGIRKTPLPALPAAPELT